MGPDTTEKESKRAFASIDEAMPSEQGGPIARIGFNYQDQIACSLFIDMLAAPDIAKIHCETHDDIVVIRDAPEVGIRSAEYVQVKSNDKTWTVADICAVRSGKGKSVYETSLARDRHLETSLFRIVTLRPVTTELQFLSFPLNAPGREPTGAHFQAAQAHLSKKFPDLKSDKGNGCDFWLSRCFWDIRDSEDAINKINLVRLLQLGRDEGRQLLLEHAQTLLSELLDIARAAGAALWHPDKAKKIITRTQLRHWWETRTQEILDGALTPSGGKLRKKMEEADLPESIILLAQELRRDYVRNVRSSRYMEPRDMDQLQSRVRSKMMSLGSQLVSGQITLNGAAFHDKCVQAVDELADDDVSPEAIAFSKGCLYDIADRCLLRFTRPSP